MTADGGMNPEMHWDEARLALGRVAELFNAEYRSSGGDEDLVHGSPRTTS